MLFFTATILSPGALPLDPGKGKAFAIRSLGTRGVGPAVPASRGQSPRLPQPYGGDRVRTDDPLLAKQVLSQLSYAPKTMVGQGGFEPPTPRLSSVCSNQLSY